MAAKKLYHITDTNFTVGPTSKDSNLNHTLSQIRYVAARLSDTTTHSEYDLQQTNKYYWNLDDRQTSIIGASAMISTESLL